MKPLILILAATAMAACVDKFDHARLFSCKDGKGYQYQLCLDCSWSTCIPCSEAKSPEARFVCFGEVKEAK